MKCRICGSYAINPHQHGRDDSDLDLCDVCYWRTRAEASQTVRRGEKNSSNQPLEKGGQYSALAPSNGRPTSGLWR